MRRLAVSMKPRRLTLFLSRIGLDSRNLGSKTTANSSQCGLPDSPPEAPGLSGRCSDSLVDQNALICCDRPCVIPRRPRPRRYDPRPIPHHTLTPATASGQEDAARLTVCERSTPGIHIFFKSVVGEKYVRIPLMVEHLIDSKVAVTHNVGRGIGIPAALVSCAGSPPSSSIENGLERFGPARSNQISKKASAQVLSRHGRALSSTENSPHQVDFFGLHARIVGQG